VAGPRQTNITKVSIGSRELGIAVGRQIDGVESLVVQGEREGERDGGDLIIPVIAYIHGARHDRTRDLVYGDLTR
jgi:hypothetical protein